MDKKEKNSSELSFEELFINWKVVNGISE